MHRASPEPKYTKMAIHRAIPVYGHLVYLGTGLVTSLFLGAGGTAPPQTSPPKLATSLDTDLKLFSAYYPLYSALFVRNVYTQGQASPV